MSLSGVCKIIDNRYCLCKDYGDGQRSEHRFTPNDSIIMELKEGDLIEIRMHRDLRRDLSVLFSGKLIRLEENNEGYIYELEAPVRERLDHKGTQYFYIVHSEEGREIINPIIGEELQLRLHVLERVKND